MALPTSRLQKRDRAARIFWRLNYTSFLTLTGRKDYIHGALFFYSELFSGNNRLDPVQARMHFRLWKESASLVTGSVVLLQFDAKWVGTLRLFTLSAFNSRLGG